MLELFVEIIRDYLPSKNLSNRAWALAWGVRVIVPITTILIVMAIVVNFFGDVPIVKRAGLKKIIDTPTQTNEESVLRSQAIFGEMAEFRNAYPQVYATFVIIPYQTSIHAFNYEDSSKNDSLVISRWELRKNINKSQFRNLTINFKKGIEGFRQRYSSNGNCTYQAMKSDEIALLRKILGNTFDATDYGLCPIKDAFKTPGKIYEVGYVLTFYRSPVSINPLTEDGIFFTIKFTALAEQIQWIILAPANSFVN